MTNHFRLRCRSCTWSREPGSLDYRCAACGGELVVEYADPPVRVRGTDRGAMWRFADRLPVDPGVEPISLGEGGTPVVALGAATRAALRGAGAWVKCEHLNPTGSFKDRIASVAVTLARQRGLAALAGTSSGNGGAAAAAYCARAGLRLDLFALADVVPDKLAQLRAHGAQVHLVDGVGHDAASTERAAVTIAGHAAANRVFPFLTGGRFSPEAMEGAKTIAYELAEQCPDATHVYVPIGGGGLLAALGRAWGELRRAGVTGPRLIAAQPAGSATLRRALDGDRYGLPGQVTTRVSGLQMAVLFDAQGACDAVLGTGGHVVEVEDEQTWAAQRLLARDSGVLVEPAGAIGLAAALRDAELGRVGADDRIVVIGSGAGFKDGAALARLAPPGAPPHIAVNEVEGVLRNGE